MNKEQQIKEMADEIFNAGVGLDGVDFAYKSDHFDRLAIKLYNAGYRKQSDVAREFGERVIKPISQVEQTASVREKSAENDYLKNYFQGYRIGCATAIIKIKEVAAEYGVEVVL